MMHFVHIDSPQTEFGLMAALPRAYNCHTAECLRDDGTWMGDVEKGLKLIQFPQLFYHTSAWDAIC
ncbi:hypothetical protein M404DRAFT_531416 [Pisolithus tinctorius Marx 270]|uniref:Uncharacterized protein n=1 Tax=Pisolithus tinctorius Marx 270 TaxID=870435 RepID=A0A0C3PBE7_PISTI|nr:hypothetical protein M404DRAFT_531416 [Pisolithus tinctorius Marx 270]